MSGEQQPGVTITLRDIYERLIEISERLAGVPEQVSDHEARLRIQEARPACPDHEERIRALESRQTVSPRQLWTTVASIIAAAGVLWSAFGRTITG